jgi:homoserine acetyltransferase
LQVDFIKKREDISKRLENNLKNLKWQSKLYDELIKETIKEIKEITKNWNNKKAIKIVRQIWFLKFLNPSFFDRFCKDKNWNKLNSFEKAKGNMLNYFQKEWIKFEKRFSLASLALLSQSIVDAKRITPDEYVKKISKKVNLIIISIEDDNLFETGPMQEYFKNVEKIRKKRWDNWFTKIEILPSWPCTKQAWHDAFLWEKPIEKINKLILKNLWNTNT